ncbi:hypothetical protein MRX96_002835 [Rhipicephalus microplus]
MFCLPRPGGRTQQKPCSDCHDCHRQHMTVRAAGGPSSLTPAVILGSPSHCIRVGTGNRERSTGSDRFAVGEPVAVVSNAAARAPGEWPDKVE